MKRISTLLLLLIVSCFAFTQPEFGTASYYGSDFQGKPTASGQIYSQNKLTAAHKTLPLGTVVKVTNTRNNKSVFVKINDRGPYVKGRIIDLSTKAAEILGYRSRGTTSVKVEIVNPEEAPLELLTASADIANENGIHQYDSSSTIDSRNTISSVNEESNETPAVNDNKIDKNDALSYNPSKDIPQPAKEINETNAIAIMNRSPYFIVTNLDKSKTGFYGVQLGIFSDASVIFAMMEELEKFKQTMLIQQEIVNGKTVYKLCMGKFQNRAYADALRSVLTDKYKDATVLIYE